jgi:four helix bundle protein
MDESEFKRRTKQFAIRVIRLSQSLPTEREADVLGRQLLRSGTSVGANYRAVCRAKSRPDMLAKLAIVEEEADESIYWMELLVESDLVSERRLASLKQEAEEILAMIVASIRTLKFGPSRQSPST